MQIEYWTIDKPKPYLRNARKIPEKAIAKVAKSLAEFGWKQPLVVDAEGVIVVGHTRLLAAKRLGWNEVPVVVAADLTPAQVKAYRLMDNRSHDETDWDLDILNLELNDLSLESIDLALTGFELPEIERALLNGLDDAAADACPEAPETPVTRPGDVWVMGPHRLMCGDATSDSDVSGLMSVGKCQLCFTSPPYNLGESVGLRNGPFRGRSSAYVGTADDSCQWSNLMREFLSLAVKSCDVVAVNVQLLSGNKVSLLRWIGDCAEKVIDIFVWNKSNPQPAMAEKVANSAFEFVVLLSSQDLPTRAVPTANFSRGTFSNVFTSSVGNNAHTKGLHGATFPAAFARHFVMSLSKRGDAVYDPFLGSGTTLIAAQELERVCYGLEIDPKYCDVIVQRWQQFTGKQAGLAVDGTGGGADGRTFEQVAYDRTEVLAE